MIGLENGSACLMADKLLDCQPYHIDDGPVTWEGSTVRSWLNSYPANENTAGIDYRGKGFLDIAFSAAQSAWRRVAAAKMGKSLRCAYLPKRVG